jgi:ERCC4-type nuclease
MPLTPTIIQDTREQTPLNITAFPVEVSGLPVGDYGIKGFSTWENPEFIIERKSLADLTNSVGNDRERFMKEILKMRQFAFRGLVIEGWQEDIWEHRYPSAITPQSVMGSLDALSVRCDLHLYWCGDSQGAARCVEQLVRHFVSGIEKDYRKLADR